MIKRAALVRDGVVENVIVIDTEAQWSPPAGVTVIDADEIAEPKGTHNGTKFVARVIPPRPTQPPSLKQQLADLQARLAALEAKRP